ncbi:component of small subunit processosome [Scheffersomyces xylosifermentans]|uniref:component of small subunit processosome n=1 Tax=Scheffersomyces xylosifermentans TaxID=1304137 RepID=UPI00315DA08A
MAGDPFLSDPSRKRKRSSKVTSTTSRSKKNSSRSNTPQRAQDEDDEISGMSDSEEESETLEVSSNENDEDQLSSDEEFADENATEKRRRLAKQYLDNLKANELNDEEQDFDAQDLDNDILAKRLQVDVAESKGYVYKFIGDKISSQIDDSTKVITTRIGSKNLTSLAVKYPFIYTVSKDAELIKWEISHDSRKKPKRIRHNKGGHKYINNESSTNNHHWGAINCVAASPDGKYVVTGGSDARLIIWSTESLSCLKVLETRSAVNSIVFRRNSDQLYAACADLKIRTYSINQFTQLEILYGHQDNICDISALARETCVSVGSRDKTAMFWKIAEESRLTFRGGDSDEKKRKKKRRDDDNNNEAAPEDELPFHNEGSIEVVSMNDESHFVTGSDNGNVALWSLAKKKALFTERLAHGLQPQYTPAKASAETSEEKAVRQVPEQNPYWITAIHAVPFSDVFITGSFDGSIKVWQVDNDRLHRFKLIGSISNVNGYVVRIDSAEISMDGSEKNKKLSVYALVSKEHKFGRWLGKVEGGRNALVSFTFDI